MPSETTVTYSKVQTSDLSNAEDGFKQEMNNQIGCVVTYEDAPLVVISIACFVAFIVYGACVGSLGASIPELARYFVKSESDFGYVFSARGVGYFAGTFSSASLLEIPSPLQNQKELFVCVSVLIIGVFTGIITMSNNFNVVLVVFWLQGFGFGMLDVYANCILPHLWETRVGPWMQALHCCFGIGAIIGPALVGSIKFQKTFILLATTSVIPSILMIIAHFTKPRNRSRQLPFGEASDESDEAKKLNEQSLLRPDVPWSVRIPIIIFFFIYVGSETAYGGWLTTYSLAIGLTESEKHGAYLVSYFWGSVAFGRMLAIFLAMCLSNTTMLRAQLLFTIFSSIAVFTLLPQNYFIATIVTIAYGFALSSIFPLAMTIATDYGYTMDSKSTSLFVIGATCGEAAVPILVGAAMDKVGMEALPVSILAFAVLLIVLYTVMHFTALGSDGNLVSVYSRESMTNGVTDDDDAECDAGMQMISPMQRSR